MGILLGDEVVSAIALNIREEFTNVEICAIYKNKPLQAMTSPCVFLHVLNSEHINELKGRASRDYLIDIRAHPKNNETTVETWAREIAERMLSCVNIISVSSQSVKLKNASWRLESGVLHLIVSYSFKVRESIGELPQMEGVQINQTIN